PATVPQRIWFGVWISILGATFAFPAAHNIDPTSPFGAWILQRFDLLPVLLWTPMLGLALTRITAKIRPFYKTLMGFTWVLICIALPLLRGSFEARPRLERGVETYARDLLATPPKDRLSIVFGTDDHRTFPVLYAQEVLGEGQQVLYIDASL